MRTRKALVPLVACLTLVAAPGSAAHERPRPIVFSAIPEGRRAGPQCQNGGDAELFTVGQASKQVRRLTRNRAHDNFPSWSPGGRRIVYSSRGREETEQDLFVRTRRGPRRRLTTGPANDFYPQWSPAGGWVVFVRVYPKRPGQSSSSDERSVMIVRADGTGLRKLTPRKRVYGTLSANWGPAGRRVVYTADSRPQASTNLFVVGRRGRNVRQLTDVAHAEYSLPDWSPDGRWITYSSYGAYEHVVRRVGPDGTRRARLSPRELIDPHFSAWGPRSRSIAFLASKTGCRYHVFRMRTGGRRAKDLLRRRDLEVYSLDW